jgi:hypothetical protein
MSAATGSAALANFQRFAAPPWIRRLGDQRPDISYVVTAIFEHLSYDGLEQLLMRVAPVGMWCQTQPRFIGID